MAITKEIIENNRYPVLPLYGLVAFPSISITVEVSDKKVSNLIHKFMRGGGKIVAVPCSAAQSAEVTESDLNTVGTVCRVARSIRPNGENEKLVLEGLCRTEINLLEKVDGAFAAECTDKTIICDDDIDCRALMLEIRTSFAEITTLVPQMGTEFGSRILLIPTLWELCDFIASNVLISQDHRLAVLGEFDPLKRGVLVAAFLQEEKEVIEAQGNVHNRVRAAMDGHHREAVLREELNAIREELGYNDEDDEEIVEYNEKIKALTLPDEVREKLLKEVKKLAKMPYSSAESSVMRAYLDTALELPWGIRTEDRTDVAAARKILDEDHDGLEKIKERILEYIAVRQLNPDIKNQIICLVGPPGTGKTSIAISLARALKRNYVRVSLGGIRDEADIRGHRRTYVASMPGRIVNAIVQAKSENPLILLDEVDKLTRDSHGDPSSALLEVLDSEQNKAFRDHFLEFPIDLSDCIFICTANDAGNIPHPLYDRMEVIELKIYTRHEKLSIARNHLIPKQLKRHGLTGRNLRMTDGAVLELIDYYTAEAGVRNLEREIGNLCRKTAKKIVEGGKKCHTITENNLSEYIGKRKVIPDKIYQDDEIGVVNGLAYTEVGGDLLRIEATAVPGNGKLELTGSLGDVMKESAKAALTYIRSHSSELSIDPDFYKTKDIHIHVPEGAVPKDGPSAGVTIVTALTSELSGKPVHRDIAMTGEVTLRGRVLAIGGLKEKTMAAYKAGVNRVFIPYDNIKDIDELDPIIREKLQFIPCRSVGEVLDGAIVH